MTGFWARLLIDDARRTKKIDKNCAKYFDALIERNDYVPWESPYSVGLKTEKRRANMDEIYMNASSWDMNDRCFHCGHPIAKGNNAEASWELLNFIKKDIDKFSYKMGERTVYLENLIKSYNPISYFSSATWMNYNFEDEEESHNIRIYYLNKPDLTKGVKITYYHIKIVETILKYLKNVGINRDDCYCKITWFEELLDRCKSEFNKQNEQDLKK